MFDFCGIEIDRDTGAIRIDKYVTMHDAGRILNPLIADGQIYGSFGWGIGCALLEEFAYGADGSFLSGTFADYLVPTRTDGQNLLEFAPGKPYAIQHERGYRGGDLTVFADDRLFTAAGLMLRDNPEFLIRFLRDLGPRKVQLADGLLELGADTPAEAIANTHLTPVILQLLALLAVFYFCRGVRFGRPHDPPTRSRRQFSEHVEALGHQYARARASRHAVRLYAIWALERLREKTLLTRTPGIYPLAQAIAGRTGDDENRVMEHLVEASSLKDATSIPATTATTDDLRLMQELARLVRLVGGPR